MNEQPCGCCTGLTPLTPHSTANRPGLASLRYRIGTHGEFLSTMLARLSELPVDAGPEDLGNSPRYPLRDLRTRDASDFSIALLDAWATVADVLTFYQERIANEGYLRTAIERRSVLELAGLVGYRAKPGVAASVFLAYTLDEHTTKPVVIPAGSKAQSVPDQGETPQMFETSEALQAKARWNNLKPRLTRPQDITLDNALSIGTIHIQGISSPLKENDALLLVFGNQQGEQVLRQVQGLEPYPDLGLTRVNLQEVPFLIVQAVAILRAVIANLSKQLAEESDAAKAELLENILKMLRPQLESFCLGEYPPLSEDYFSHQRIYEFLESRGQRLIWSTASASTLSLPSEPAILALLNAILAQLNEPWVRNQSICLATTVLQQLLPTTLRERELFFQVLSSPLIAWGKTFSSILYPSGTTGSTVPFFAASTNSTVPESFKQLLLALLGFLQYKPLREALDALLELVKDAAEDGDDVELLQSWLDALGAIPNDPTISCGPPALEAIALADLINPLLTLPSVQPPHSANLLRDVATAFGNQADALPQVLTSLYPRLGTSLYQAWGKARVQASAPKLRSLYLLGTTASPFGANAQTKMGLKPNTDTSTSQSIPFVSVPAGDWTPREGKEEKPDRLFLDGPYDSIRPGTWLVLCNASQKTRLALRAESAAIGPRTAYNVSTKTTQIELSRDWWKPGQEETINPLRKTAVRIVTAELKPAPEPILDDISGKYIELNELQDGLSLGRWAIITGERTDIEGTSGVMGTELVMIAGIEQVYRKDLPLDNTHTLITLAEPLAYTYRRTTAILFGNVVKATHGDTRSEVLGGGDGSRAFQSFSLGQAPLTHVAAPTPAGTASTLRVYVDQVEWLEAESLVGLGATERRFITQTLDNGKTSLYFGNGREGARLPTGLENIRAEYRKGIGKPGNVKAGKIIQTISRPQGVKAVINPLAASGGADAETRDQMKKHAPLRVTALDRLVSVQDYEDFARSFAGIGKAFATELADGGRRIVHLTVAGADDIPIDGNSDLLRHLREALRTYGDPMQTVQVAVRELMLLVLAARVKILPEYRWEVVQAQLTATLLDIFSFERRELGQDALLSEAIRAMQAVEGVVYVDVDRFRGIPEKTVDAAHPDGRRFVTPEDIAKWVSGPLVDANGRPLREPAARIQVNLTSSVKGALQPAQLAFFSPEVPASLIFNLIA